MSYNKDYNVRGAYALLIYIRVLNDRLLELSFKTTPPYFLSLLQRAVLPSAPLTMPVSIFLRG